MTPQTIKTVEFEKPNLADAANVDAAASGSCVAHAWAKVPPALTPDERTALKDRIRKLLKERNAVLVAHYYVDADLQDLAEETGGCVSDSLEMARFGRDHSAKTLVVAGVRFMGETAKILSPEKTVLMPDLDATCSLDLGCPPDEFAAFCDAHPDRTVVVYANTSAAVKARADWMVTSSIGLDIVKHLHEQGKKIICIDPRRTETAQFAGALERSIASGKPALIEVVIDPNAITTQTTIEALRDKALKARARPPMAARCRPSMASC